MTLTNEIKKIIADHAKEVEPDECVGLVLRGGGLADGGLLQDPVFTNQFGRLQWPAHACFSLRTGGILARGRQARNRSGGVPLPVDARSSLAAVGGGRRQVRLLWPCFF